MASGMAWFKVDVNVHSSPKIAALSDCEFRMLTYIWALAQRSSLPGVVCLTPTEGLGASDLARGAGCDCADPTNDGESAADALKRLAQLQLVEAGSDGIISVHDWDEWNGRAPSKTPEARREQGRADRARRKEELPTSEADRKTEKRRVREEEEVETTLAPSAASQPPAPATPFGDYVRAEWPDLKNPEDFEKQARAAFPAVDPLVEARKARGWELSDPKRRKVSHGKFLWGWLGRTQDGASATGIARPRYAPPKDPNYIPPPSREQADYERRFAEARRKVLAEKGVS